MVYGDKVRSKEYIVKWEYLEIWLGWYWNIEIDRIYGI